MPPPSSPSTSQLLGINSLPSYPQSIPHPGDSRGQPTTIPPMGSHPLETPAEIDECSLLARLDQKRREIEAEIEAFKLAKEDEYRALERQLREQQKQSKRRKHENGGASAGGEKATNATHGAAGATSPDDEEGVTRRRDQVGCHTTGAQISLDLGGSKLNDALKLELPGNRKQPDFDGSSSSATSPPYEKELQIAGLFTPRYLPLLDNNYYRQNPSISPPLQDPSSNSDQTPPQSLIPKLTTIPTSSSRMGNTSPAYPLASSLKSSSGSSTGTLSKSGTMKQKSPKRVTFQFEDENSVPSRSSPPPTKVHWTLEDQFEDEGGFLDEGEEVEEVDEDEFDEISGKVEQVENVTESSGVLVQRFPGDELVVPMDIGDNGSSSSSIVQGNNEFNGLGIHGVSGGFSTNGINGGKAGSDSTDDEANGYDDDDDEEALFDLDETIPEVLDNSPPQRDYSALLDSQPPQTNDRLTASKFPMLPSFTPSVPPIPASATDSLLTFGKSPGPRLGLPRIRRGSLSASLSPILSQKQFDEQVPAASSLPSHGWKGIDPPTSGFVPTPGGRFRRRSIVKYDLPDDDSASLKGKGKETQHPIDEEEDDEEDALLLLGRSPSATSLPVSISRHSPAMFTSNSGSSTRSPKPQLLPANKKGTPDTVPVSGRPSPKPRSSPLSGARVAEPPKIDSADILASMSTSFSTLDNEGAPEKNDTVSSYRRSSPFPSAYDRTPYLTAYAAEVAAAAALDDEDYGGAMESVVGGVDGRTGMDPDVSGFSYRASSLRVGDGSRVKRASLVGGSASLGGVDPGRMSLGMRMAFESAQEEADGRRGGR